MAIDLKDAYGLKTPEDSRRLYATWAASYDSGFAQAMAYRFPEAVAAAAARWHMTGPILDVGAGTGLVGLALKSYGLGPIDGTDIAPEMLEKAAQKSCYAAFFQGDILAGLACKSQTYQGITSSGTFTTGHVGPEALPEIVRLLCPGGLAVLSVSRAHWHGSNFPRHIDTLPGITARAVDEVSIYGDGAVGDHAADTAYLLRFRRR